jgi:hypothetical protein
MLCFNPSVTKNLSKIKVLAKDGEKLFHELNALNPWEEDMQGWAHCKRVPN